MSDFKLQPNFQPNDFEEAALAKGAGSLVAVGRSLQTANFSETDSGWKLDANGDVLFRSNMTVGSDSTGYMDWNATTGVLTVGITSGYATIGGSNAIVDVQTDGLSKQCIYAKNDTGDSNDIALLQQIGSGKCLYLTTAGTGDVIDIVATTGVGIDLDTTTGTGIDIYTTTGSCIYATNSNSADSQAIINALQAGTGTGANAVFGYCSNSNNTVPAIYGLSAGGSGGRFRSTKTSETNPVVLIQAIENGGAHLRLTVFSGNDVDVSSPTKGDLWFNGDNLKLYDGTATQHIAHSDGTTGGTDSAGAGNQYVELEIGGTIYKILHDGTV